MCKSGSIVSLQVGSIQKVDSKESGEWWDKEWSTGLFKATRPESCWLDYQGFKGDEQADKSVHGGVDKAICVYPSEHYTHWKNVLNQELPFGAFGENLTIGGLLERELCIGDQFALGDAVVEVSQPRSPCWKIARRWKHKTLAKEVQDTGKTGFYFRVLRHGKVKATDTLELQHSGEQRWTIDACNKLAYEQGKTTDYLELSTYAPLSGSWKDNFYQKYLKLSGVD